MSPGSSSETPGSRPSVRPVVLCTRLDQYGNLAPAIHAYNTKLKDKTIVRVWLEYNSTFITPLLSGSSRKTHQTVSNGIHFELNETNNHVEQNVPNKRLSWKDLLPQILACVVAFMLVTQPGINMVYSNIFLNHYEFTDVSELSWLMSVLVICTPIGVIAVGMIMDRIGRKNAVLLTCVPLLISWLIASVAQRENMILIYTSRFFAGIGGGMTSMVVVYVSEITHSSSRQALLSLNSVFFSVGILFATTVSSLFRWQIVNVVFFVFTVVTSILSAVCLPESPVWLIKFRTDRVYEAKSSLKRIYPKNDQVFAEEWDRLHYAASQDTPALMSAQLAMSRWFCRRRWWSWWSLQPPTVTGPIRVLTVMFLLQQLSGCYAVVFYAVPVFQAVVGGGGGGGDALSQADTLIVLGAVRLLTSAVACALSSRVGRRPLLIGSSLAMACSAVLVASTAVEADYDPPPDGGGGERATPVWPLLGVAAFVCSGSVGVLVFPWTLVGELLPVSARAVAGAVLVAYAYALMFVVLKAFPYFVARDSGGGGGSVAVAFAVFAVASAAMAAYTHACLPETLGKRFDEIERYFADPSR